MGPIRKIRFSFLTMLLVFAGGLLQFAVYNRTSCISAAITPANPRLTILPVPSLEAPPPASAPYVPMREAD